MVTVQDIPFRRIPHQSKLFLDYLDLSPVALSFYQNPPTLEHLENLARSCISELQTPRKVIAGILRRQNEIYGGDSETQRQIDELEKPDSVAILTGQQVGLFTGPLYTVYKAATAVQICGELQRRRIRAVPIFWMETEDHDLKEVACRTVLDLRSSLHTIDYRNTLFQDAEMSSPVGSLKFPEGIRKAVRDYLGHYPDSDWISMIQSQLEAACEPGVSLTTSFARLMLQIFGGSGLILYNPQDAESKHLTSTMFRKVLRDAETFRAALLRRNQELDAAGFHAQVSVPKNSTLLFLIDDGARCALERRDSGFGLKSSKRTFTLDELMNIAERTPDRFSPNVLLRPLIQDHLFPTVAYVGGSSELAYFAQIEALYTLLGRPMPVIWPRSSFTILEPEIAAEMDRLGLGFQNCFQEKQAFREKLVRESGYSKALMSMDSLQESLDRGLTEILPEVQAIELPLVQALETARRKILHNIQRLKSRVVRLEEGQVSSVSNVADRLLNYCYPNRNLQERELSIHHFLARRGPSLLDVIRSAIDIGNFAHRVLRLEDGG